MSLAYAASMIRAHVRRSAVFAVSAIIGACSPAPASPFPSSASSPNVVPTIVTGAGGDGDLRIAELKTCVLDSGEKIEGCRIGYRTYGKLDGTKSNAILFPTWFTGETKNLVDSVPNKIVDTKRFYLILVESLGNGISSSPSTSRTQPRLKFPKFTIHDMVESQRRLLREVLGIQRIHTVMGISMGGMQSFEWAVSHPDEVGRIAPIVGTPQLTAQDLLLWTAELHVLEGSSAYENGEYKVRPKIPALQELHWLNLTTPTHRNAETSRAQFAAWDETHASDTFFDWNDWHRQLEAMLAHDVARAYAGDLTVAAQKVKAKALIIVANQDHMVNPEPAKTFQKAMTSKSTLLALDSPCGHMVPGCDSSIEPAIRKFIEEP
jgi:homoserine O-acetyltransferase